MWQATFLKFDRIYMADCVSKDLPLDDVSDDAVELEFEDTRDDVWTSFGGLARLESCLDLRP